MEKGKRKRAAKVTAGQYQIYLETLQSNEAFKFNKFNPKKNPDVLDESWTSLAVKLNAAGGPVKTVQEWKQRFSDWKCNVRKKARKIALSEIKTGGGPPDIPLTEMENTLLDLTGRTVISGIEVPELSLDDDPLPENIPTTSTPRTSSGLEDVRSPIPQPPTPSSIKNHDAISTNTSDPENVRSPTTPRSMKKHQKRVPLTTSVGDMIENESKSNDFLEDISNSLKTLIKLKKRELMLSELKLRLKHPEIEFNLNDDSD